MATGMVMYLGHDSARTIWVWFDAAGRRRGALLPRRGSIDATNQAASPTSSVRLRLRRVDVGESAPVRIGLDRDLSRSRRNFAYTLQADGTWVRDGEVRNELERTASGAVVHSRDAGGMFIQVAQRLKRTHRLPDQQVIPFTDTLADDDEAHGSEQLTSDGFFASLESVPVSGLDFFAYSGHGAADGLASAGIRTTHAAKLSRLANALTTIVRAGGSVILYACLTGHDGGFAQELSRLLPGMTVWGHDTSDQASRNPRKVRCRNGVRQPIASLIGEGNVRRWEEHLGNDPDFYARFPFMTIEEIREEITPTAASPLATR